MDDSAYIKADLSDCAFDRDLAITIAAHQDPRSLFLSLRISPLISLSHKNLLISSPLLDHRYSDLFISVNQEAGRSQTSCFLGGFEPVL